MTATPTSIRDRGSVSVALYLHDLAPADAVATHRDQGRVALTAGFDGVTVSEHHAGFRGYLPVPTLAAARILGSTESGWVAPCPLLLPLRNPAIVAEELAWLAAMHPGRVAAGLAAGYSPQDFTALGVEPEGAARRLRDGLAHLRALGTPEGALAHDPAVTGVLPDVPLVVCTGGPLGARHAARHGMGLMLPPQDPTRNLETAESYLAAGGDGPRLLGQWVWVGTPPVAGLDGLRDAYPAVDEHGNRKYAPGVLHADDPEEIADTLAADIRAFGLTGLNLRVHLPGVGPEETTAQLRVVGERLVPLLRDRLAPEP